MAFKIDWSWPKVTALTTIQAAVHTAVPLIVGHNVLHLDWAEAAGLSGASALVALGGSILAYTLPGAKATAAISAPVAAVQELQAVPVVPEANEARSSN